MAKRAILVNGIFEAILDKYLTICVARTPLDIILKHLDLALDTSVDHKTREILSKAQDASNSLISVMDDLLRLIDGDDKANYPTEETFDLKLTGKSEVDFYGLY
jgi:hypothetical protein